MRRKKMLGVWLTVMGLACLFGGYRLHRHRSEFPKWPTVQGRIARKEVRLSGEMSPPFSYAPDVVYVYEVDGKTYFGKEIWWGGEVAWKLDYTKRFLESLPDVVTVHYNPKNPAEACLFGRDTTDQRVLNGLAFGFGIVLTVIGVLALLPDTGKEKTGLEKKKVLLEKVMRGDTVQWYGLRVRFKDAGMMDHSDGSKNGFVVLQLEAEGEWHEVVFAEGSYGEPHQWMGYEIRVYAERGIEPRKITIELRFAGGGSS
jgi:hypothetical protein